MDFLLSSLFSNGMISRAGQFSFIGVILNYFFQGFYRKEIFVGDKFNNTEWIREWVGEWVSTLMKDWIKPMGEKSSECDKKNELESYEKGNVMKRACENIRVRNKEIRGSQMDFTVS